ncbi:MAG: hypothetical protein V9F01_14395 [Chitinophagaceae bacterium]
MEQKNIEQRLKRLNIWLAVLTVLSLIAIGLSTFQFLSKNNDDHDIPIKIYKNMKLTHEKLVEIFTPMDPNVDPNNIKEVYYSWYENRTNEYGLEAYGVDANGQQLSQKVKLVIPNLKDYETNWNYDTELMVNTRGQLKYLLGSQYLGQDRTIEPGKLTEITFVPLMRAYPGSTSTMFFDMKSATPGVSILANPAPPFSFTCTNCDAR